MHHHVLLTIKNKPHLTYPHTPDPMVCFHMLELDLEVSLELDLGPRTELLLALDLEPPQTELMLALDLEPQTEILLALDLEPQMENSSALRLAM